MADNDDYELLLSYLEQDSNNESLLLDCANAALEKGDLEQSCALFNRLDDIEPLTGDIANLSGIAHMRLGALDKAQEIFESLYINNPSDKALQFNLAWTAKLANNPDLALSYLNQQLTDELPQAAMLKLQIMHEAGEFEEAGKNAKIYLKQHNDYEPLLATISVLALDIEDEQLARESASRAGNHPDALTTLATLSLGDQKNEDARQLFKKSLNINDQSPRAWIGLGLTDIATGDHKNASRSLDKGAAMFGDHLGSWIAAGWSHLFAQDIESANARFEKALQLDQNFSETHGSLAVIDVMEGNIESAKRRIAVAMKLDKKCFAASYAQILLAQTAGDTKKAEKILNLSLNQPIGQSGKTIAQIIADIGQS